MKIYRKPTFADSTGDAIPFYHQGKYHIFSLTPPVGTTVYPARLRTTWSHACSENLVDWEELGTALVPGTGSEPDADGCWTGSVIHVEGNYHIFYTGYNIKADFQQTICHAVSKDGIVWEKDPGNPCITPKTDLYESLDWRDPYVFYNEEDACYWILISARRKTGSPTRRGCVVLYRSNDLKSWDYFGPIYEPRHTNCPECPEMWKSGDNWFLSYSTFSEFVQTIYRVSKSPFGPWRTPKYDGIGGRRFYAAKSMVDKNGRRFYFGWAHDRAERSDEGEWYWGGAFAIPHEVVATKEGELEAKMPKEIIDTFDTLLKWTFKPMEGECRLYDDRHIAFHSIGTFAYGFCELEEKSFMMSCRIRPGDCSDYFGLVLKSDKNVAKCLILAFECGMQRVSLINLPMAVDPFWAQSCTNILTPRQPGPDGPRVCEKAFEFKNGDVIDVKVVIDNDLVEVFVQDKIAFTYRSYEKPDYEVGFVVQDGNAEFYNVKFMK